MEAIENVNIFIETLDDNENIEFELSKEIFSEICTKCIKIASIHLAMRLTIFFIMCSELSFNLSSFNNHQHVGIRACKEQS